MTEKDFNPGAFINEWKIPVIKRVFELINEPQIYYAMCAMADVNKTPIMILNLYLPDNLNEDEIKLLANNDRFRMLTGRMVKQVLCFTGDYEHIENSSKVIPESKDKVLCSNHDFLNANKKDIKETDEKDLKEKVSDEVELKKSNSEETDPKDNRIFKNGALYRRITKRII